MKQEKDLKFYQELMPHQLTLEIQKSEEVFWAKVKELPYCYTQAKDFFELIEMVNDTVYTYLEIPDAFRKMIGFYVPKRLSDEIRKREWERMFRELSQESNLREGVATFQMCLR